MEDYYIVGIGSSAGGIKALFEFFSNLKEPIGAAFVVVPHLSRDHHSVLYELLNKKTFLQTKAIENGEIVEPNVVYVLPENRKVTINKGILFLKERPEEEKINKAIDTFFVSLAEDQKDNAIGIVLSGLGSDGTEGAIQIKKRGGIVLVQDPATAGYTNMPSNTIHYDHPDHILAPAKMPGILAKYSKTQIEERSR